jgi:hypothetical protein
MKKINLFIYFVGFFLVAAPVSGFANDGKPVYHMKFRYVMVTHLLTDSLPVKAAKMVSAPDSAIREVPKSRKQQVPIAVTTQIKPIKIIKPKIIKALIKVLH